MRTISWVGRSVFVCSLLLAPALASAQPAPCKATDGKGVAACVNEAFPDRLKPTATLKERTDNAVFLRNRLIETARCAKLDVGLNLKRGGPSISVDFIAWKHPKGHTQGVDVIGGWDDIKKPIKVGWHDSYGPPNFGHPTFKAYGAVSCLGQPDPEPVPPPVDDFNAKQEIEKLRFDIAQLVLSLQNTSKHFTSSLDVLREELKALHTTVAVVEAQVLGYEERITVIESKPLPSGCSVQFGLRCRLQ
jgi:hypothetical protein